MSEWQNGLIACEAMIKSCGDIDHGWKSAYDYYIMELSDRGVYSEYSPSVEYLNGWFDCVEHYKMLNGGIDK